MSDLMPCQMCGSPPFDDGQRGVSFTTFACECVGSGLRFDENEEARKLARLHWNEMQRLIARGKLLDEPSSPSMKARL